MQSCNKITCFIPTSVVPTQTNKTIVMDSNPTTTAQIGKCKSHRLKPNQLLQYIIWNPAIKPIPNPNFDVNNRNDYHQLFVSTLTGDSKIQWLARSV